MNRINFGQQALHLVFFVLVQIVLLYKFILFDVAFGFFYVGFILYLPFGLSRGISMTIAFLAGLTIDIFSNTPGIHASACVLIAFTKDFWASIVLRRSDEDLRIDWNTLQLLGTIKYIIPLILIHHFLIFTIENDGFSSIGILLSKIFFSSLYSFVSVLLLSILMAPKMRKV